MVCSNHQVEDLENSWRKLGQEVTGHIEESNDEIVDIFVLRLHNFESLSSPGMWSRFLFFFVNWQKRASGVIIIIRWNILRSSTRRRASTGTNNLRQNYI